MLWHQPINEHSQSFGEGSSGLVASGATQRLRRWLRPPRNCSPPCPSSSQHPCLESGGEGARETSLSIFQIFLEDWILRFSCVFAG